MELHNLPIRDVRLFCAKKKTPAAMDDALKAPDIVKGLEETPTSVVAKNSSSGSRTAALIIRRKTTKDASQSSESVKGLEETPTSVVANNLPSGSPTGATTTRTKTTKGETQLSELVQRSCLLRNNYLSGELDQENRNPNVRRAAASSKNDDSVQRVYNAISSVNLSGKSMGDLRLKTKKPSELVPAEKNKGVEKDDPPAVPSSTKRAAASSKYDESVQGVYDATSSVNVSGKSTAELSLISKESITERARKKKDPEEEDDNPGSKFNASSSNLNPPTFKFKLLIVGERGTGKTALLNRHLGAVEKRVRMNGDRYIYPIEFLTSRGRICFEACDTHIRDESYLPGVTCAIIMFDVSYILSYVKAPLWYRFISGVCGRELPIVVCGNKMDLDEREIKVTDVTFQNMFPNMDYYELSVLSNYNFEKVFLHLARKLFRDKNLQIDSDSYTLARQEVPIRPGCTFLSRARRQLSG